jgi:hypothetical protein
MKWSQGTIIRFNALAALRVPVATGIDVASPGTPCLHGYNLYGCNLRPTVLTSLWLSHNTKRLHKRYSREGGHLICSNTISVGAVSDVFNVARNPRVQQPFIR